MSYFVTSQTPIGTVQNDNTKQIVKYHFEVDTIQDLPTKNQFESSGIIIAMTSTAHVIQTNNNYEMDSSGTWIRQKSNSNIMLDAENVIYDNTNSGLSAENVQDAIDEIKSNDDMQDRALAELYAENTNQQLEINYAINTSAKNLLKNTRTTTTHKGITFTVNADGSVTANGTNDGTGASLLDINTQASLGLASGDYILSGCPSGGGETSYVVDAIRSPGASLKDTGSGVTFTVGGDYTVSAFRIVVSRNVSVDNLTFYPMIRPASITDDTFVPYALSNHVLTPAAVKAVDEGAKNLLHFDQLGYSTVQGMSMVHRGVTFTLTDDTVVCSGTNDNTDNSHCRLYIGSDRVYVTDLCDGNHILSGTPSGGGAGKWSMSAYYGVSGVTQYNRSDYGEGVLLTEPSESGYNILIDISISKGQNASGLIFKPMICTAADWAVSQKFVPYAPTNRELYEEKIGIEDVYGAGTKIDANTNFNDLKIHGLYYSISTQDISSFTNCPVSAQFTLSVKFGSQAVFQEIQPMSKTEIMYRYVRMFTNGTWSSWYKFEGTVVTTTQSVQSLRTAEPLNNEVEEELLNEGYIEDEER